VDYEPSQDDKPARWTRDEEQSLNAAMLHSVLFDADLHRSYDIQQHLSRHGEPI
jgi:hypothetical protein